MEIKDTKEIVMAYAYDDATIKKWITVDDVISEMEKDLQRLRGYSCGHHKQLEKQMLNRIKGLVTNAAKQSKG